jgi:hypothetical protein
MNKTYFGTVLKLREASASDPGVLDVHIIKPGWGASGYYPEQTLRQAVDDGVYHEGMHMYWDHATESESWERPERSLSALAGALVSNAVYEQSGWDGPGVYATAKAFPEFMESLGAMGGNIGVSHSVMGVSEWGKAEGKEGQIISEIHADPLNSVDFVTIPGAGGHYRTVFAEAAKHTKTKEEAHMPTIDEVKKDKALMEALKAEFMKESDLKKLQAELKESLKKQDDLETALTEAKAKALVQESRTYIVAKVAESKLPTVSQKYVVESLISGAVAEVDGALDTVALDEAITKAIEAKQAEIDAILTEAHTNTGVHDMGGATDVTETDGKEMYYETLIRAGKPEDVARKLAGID